MYLKIHNPNTAVGKNTGSASNLVEYLDKENRDLKDIDKTQFFNKDGDHFSPSVVEKSIDKNKSKLKKTDTKFYMLTVNPSQRELKHIDGDEKKFKSYIRDVMDKYAENFNRTYKDQTPLTGDDILYYAKIEHERTYKFNEKRFEKPMQINLDIQREVKALKKELEVSNPNAKKDIDKQITELESKYIRNKEGAIIKEGAKKDGNNMHAHIIVSRLDKTQKVQLSPMTNHKKSKNIVNGKKVDIGFDRDKFVQTCEKTFDNKFEYDRDYYLSYKYHKETKQIQNIGNVLHLTDPLNFAKMTAKRAIKEMVVDKTLHKHLGYVVSPKKLPKKAIQQLEKKAIESVMKNLGAVAYTNPVTAAVQVAKQAITIASKVLSKGMGI